MELSKQQLLDVLVRTGRRELLDRAERELPDTIDTDKIDPHLLLQLGLDRDSLVDRMGGSP